MTQPPRDRETVAAAPVVASVAVEVGLAHLDRPFDYTVPASAPTPTVGCRVRVPFAGRQVGGFVLRLGASTAHGGRLQPLRRVVSPEPVLTPAVARLARAVANRYAGTLADVLRLAVPPRHARVEREAPAGPGSRAGGSGPVAPGPEPAAAANAGREAWRAAGAGDGSSLPERLAAGGSPRAAWTALPGDDWPAALAVAAAACVDSGRGALLCLPDRRDVDRVDAALGAVLGPGRHVVLTADLGPAPRYRAFLAALRGSVPVVVGTRAAAFAPVQGLGLAVIWDDGDDLHAEPRAPYPHARDVLALRAHQEGAGLLVAGHARTSETQQLVESGWLSAAQAGRDRVRAAWPRVTATGGATARVERDPAARAARLPHEALSALRTGLARGPVLLHVPRTGYRTRLACQDCRTPAACPACQGPLGQSGPGRPPDCRWCGRPEPDWRCANCGSDRLRAPVVGEQRTAEELGRAFPGVPVRRSSGDGVLAGVPDEAAVVVATPGAEPPAAHGYAAAVLLDVGLSLARPDLRATEDSLRRWLGVVALVRPATRGGVVVVVAEPSLPVVQALVRADPAGFAARELAERRAARMPPAARLATVEGPAEAVAELADRRRVATLTGAGWPEPADLLGPVQLAPDLARLVVRVPRSAGPALTRTLAALQAARTARKAAPLRVVVDPAELG